MKPGSSQAVRVAAEGHLQPSMPLILAHVPHLQLHSRCGRRRIRVCRLQWAVVGAAAAALLQLRLVRGPQLAPDSLHHHSWTLRQAA